MPPPQVTNYNPEPIDLKKPTMLNTLKIQIPATHITSACDFFSSFFCALDVMSREIAVKIIENTRPITPMVIKS